MKQTQNDLEGILKLPYVVICPVTYEYAQAYPDKEDLDRLFIYDNYNKPKRDFNENSLHFGILMGLLYPQQRLFNFISPRVQEYPSQEYAEIIPPEVFYVLNTKWVTDLNKQHRFTKVEIISDFNKLLKEEKKRLNRINLKNRINYSILDSIFETIANKGSHLPIWLPKHKNHLYTGYLPSPEIKNFQQA